MICAECQRDLPSLKSLHSHIRSHGYGVNSYYMTHFPRHDKLTGNLIPCMDWREYLTQDFRVHENYVKWLENAPYKEAAEYIAAKFKERKEAKEITHMPPDSYLFFSKMASRDNIERYCAGYENFCAQQGVIPWFNESLPLNFWNYDPRVRVFQDSRERNPLWNGWAEKVKLEFADYTAIGQKYDRTFLERKTSSDFISTFGNEITRFRKEMDRAIEQKCYLFVLVESSYRDPFLWNSKFCKKQYIEYVFHNVKDLMVKYPENIQFIFTKNRAVSEKLGMKILWHGKSLWRVDLQREINKRMGI